jgi:hypothetical protein
MTESIRPKRVVIVDADNPMEEIRGELFWREDHERALADAREAAFRDGYTHGWADASRGSPWVTFRTRRRPRHLMLRALFLLAAIGYGASLITNIAR